jgi:DNA-binding transcriptional regulator YiaG
MQKRPTLVFKSSSEILKIRHRLGLRQDQFWQAVGVTQSGGSRYENGRRVPQPVAILLSIAYGTPTQATKTVATVRRMREQKK